MTDGVVAPHSLLRGVFKRPKESVISRADRAREAGQWGLAARLYREALDRNPSNPPIWVQYGHALKELGQMEAGEAAYRQAIAYDPNCADAYLQLGHILKLQGRSSDAPAAYLRALVIDRSLADAARELAALGWSPAQLSPLQEPAGSNFAATGTASADENGRRRASGRFRRKNVSRITLADRARTAGQWELAARLYRKALERNPRNPPIWVQYGHALKESGSLADAEAAYRRAIADEPRNADSHLQLGHVLKMQRKHAAAEACYLRAWALDPSPDHPPQGLSTLGWSEAEVNELKGLLGGGASHPVESTGDKTGGSGAQRLG
jgi:tetratricopeptide (TPR) repeat protein